MNKIYLMLILLLSVNSTNADDVRDVLLKGFIDKYPITMNLNIIAKDYIISGEYSYDKYNTPIKLTGVITDSEFYDYLLDEETGKFKLQSEYYCYMSGLTGTWTSATGKELSVNLSKVTEETSFHSKNGEEFKLIKKLIALKKHDYSISTVVKFDNRKFEIPSDCNSNISLHDVSKLTINNQKLYKFFWKVSHYGTGYIEENHTAYLHENGDSITFGVSGERGGDNNYLKDTCKASLLNDVLVRTCLHEELIPKEDVYAYKEQKMIENFSVTENGFSKLTTELSQRGTEEETEQPYDLIRSVAKMPWELISK